MAERRITGTVGTIPNYTPLSGTTVTSQTDTTVLISTGTDDLEDIMFKGGIGLDSVYWIYCPAATPKIAKIIGLYKISETGTPTVYSFNIQLEEPMTGLSGDACNFVKAGIAYSYLNDGGASGTVNGVTIKNGEGATYAPYEKYSNRQKLHPVAYVDASATDFLIVEEL